MVVFRCNAPIGKIFYTSQDFGIKFFKLLMVLNVENYLRRISFHDDIRLSLNTLTALHRKHIQNIPFENLDISRGRKIQLDLPNIERKIITHRRGGFCYELNGLFDALLRELGFDVRLLSARVCGKGKIGREFDHLVLKVRLDEDWLVDVGFGDNFLEPIQIETGMKQRDPTGTFRIVKYDSTYLRLESDQDGSGYLPKYLFTLDERQLEDFSEMCEYHQTSPESSFTQGQICTMSTKSGRVTLRDDRLTETNFGNKTTRAVMDDEEFDDILKERFGIEIKLR